MQYKLDILLTSYICITFKTNISYYFVICNEHLVLHHINNNINHIILNVKSVV